MISTNCPKVQRPDNTPTGEPKLIYVAYGDGFTSALVKKETRQGWLVRRRFRDERDNVELERPRRFWKRDLGEWVWEDLAHAKADTTRRLTVKLELRHRQVADLQEALMFVADYQPAEVT